jgi:hypothetical protein
LQKQIRMHVVRGIMLAQLVDYWGKLVFGDAERF